MNIALCESADKQHYKASNKAPADVLKILLDLGYTYIPLFYNGESHAAIIRDIIFHCIKTGLKAGKDDSVFIQYPYSPIIASKVMFFILGSLKRIKHYQLILLIHDVPSIRSKKWNFSTSMALMKRELNIIKNADNVIFHNETMANLFKQAGYSKKYAVLEPFDYLYDGPPVRVEYNRAWSVVIAGNLSILKCAYVYKLAEISGINFNLFGSEYTGQSSSHVRYYGKFGPEELIEHLVGHFGLVWDGDSCETCSGIYGQYLRYNNPHKFSLYLAAGLPVIVWSKSALATYVQEKGIGLCIDSLYDLTHVLAQFDCNAYNNMLDRVNVVRKDITCGEHLKSALQSLM